MIKKYIYIYNWNEIKIYSRKYLYGEKYIGTQCDTTNCCIALATFCTADSRLWQNIECTCISVHAALDQFHNIGYIFSLSNKIVKVFKFENVNVWTCLKVQAMIFSHICIGKWEIYIFYLQKKLPSPDNKFLLHTVGAIGKISSEKTSEKFPKRYSMKNENIQYIKFNFSPTFRSSLK